MNPIPRRLWQVAGVLTMAHVVLIPISIALQMVRCSTTAPKASRSSTSRATSPAASPAASWSPSASC